MFINAQAEKIQEIIMQKILFTLFFGFLRLAQNKFSVQAVKVMLFLSGWKLLITGVSLNIASFYKKVEKKVKGVELSPLSRDNSRPACC